MNNLVWQESDFQWLDEEKSLEKHFSGEKFEIKNADIPLSVKAIIFDDFGRLLLLQNDPKITQFEFDLPGGHADDKKDESLIEALTRELKEETNLDLVDAEQFDTETEVKIGTDNHLCLFFKVIASGPIKTGKEHLGYSWVFPDDLDMLDLGAFKEPLKEYFDNKDRDILQKLQPPRPGLVPQTGDYDRPFRWIRPASEKKLSFEQTENQLSIGSMLKNIQSVRFSIRKLNAFIKQLSKQDEDYFGMGPDELKEELDDAATVFLDLIDDPNFHYIYVNSEKTTEAIGWYQIRTNANTNQKDLILEELGTHPKNLRWNPNQAERIRGAGTFLIKSLVKIASDQNIDMISLVASPTAEVFYKKLGFKRKAGGIFELSKDKFNQWI